MLRTKTGARDLKRIQQFKYLGSVLNDKGTSEKEKNSDTALVKAAFNKREASLSKNLNLDLKKGWARPWCGPCRA